MKKIFLAIAIALLYATIADAQSHLDTTAYHLYFFDDFNYPVSIPTYGTDLMTSTAHATSATLGTTVDGQVFSDNWFIKDNAIDTGFHEMFYYNNVEMSAPGILRIDLSPVAPFTTTFGTGTAMINAYSGWFGSNWAFGYGVYEMKLKTHLPSGTGADGGSGGQGAIWVGPSPGPTEIDFPDNFTDKDGEFKVWNWGIGAPTLQGRHTITKHSFSHILSDDFHILSFVWTPSNVQFYIDRVLNCTIPYNDIRTIANSDIFHDAATGSDNPFKYAFLAVIWAHSPTADNWVEFDWIKYWKPNCTPDVSLTNTNLVSGGFNAPNIITDFSRNNNILVSVTDTPFTPITVGNCIGSPPTDCLDPATILEAASTTILPNFIADESTLVYETKTVQGTVIGDSVASLIYNGYFEILSISCDHDDLYYRKSSDSNSNGSNNATTNATKAGAMAIGNGIKGDVDKINTQIQVYPNPAKENVTINYPCTSNGQLEISIKDVSGRVRYVQSVACSEGSNAQYVLDLSSFEQGVYFIQLTLNSQSVVKKIVKL